MGHVVVNVFHDDDSHDLSERSQVSNNCFAAREDKIALDGLAHYFSRTARNGMNRLRANDDWRFCWINLTDVTNQFKQVCLPHKPSRFLCALLRSTRQRKATTNVAAVPPLWLA